MTLDDSGRRVIVAFRNPPKLSVRDMETGAPVAERGTCGDVDDVFFDSKRQRVYVTCGEGAIDVFDARADYAPMARVATRRGTRTSLFVRRSTAWSLRYAPATRNRQQSGSIVRFPDGRTPQACEVSMHDVHTLGAALNLRMSSEKIQKDWGRRIDGSAGLSSCVGNGMVP